MLEANRRYCAIAGASLSTYATPFVAGEIAKCIGDSGLAAADLARRYSETETQPDDFHEPFIQRIGDPRAEDACEQLDLESDVTRVRDALTPNEWSVLRQVFWLDRSQIQVARDRHVSANAINKIYKRALRKAGAALQQHAKAA